jgi:hypothetical protein
MAFEIKHFPTLAIGTVFTVDGETFIKHSELVFRDPYGLEHYIDPLFDVKLGRELAGKAVAAPQVDTSAKIVKGESEQE